jgi:uncharacterized membrane protein
MSSDIAICLPFNILMIIFGVLGILMLSKITPQKANLSVYDFEMYKFVIISSSLASIAIGIIGILFIAYQQISNF